MSLLKHHIEKVVSVKPYEEEWAKENPEHTYVIVTHAYKCHGLKNYTSKVFRTDEWEQIKEQGYYMA